VLALACVLAVALAADARSPTAKAKPLDAPGCSFAVIDTLDFGSYDDASSSASLTTATFRVKCKGVGNDAVTLAAGPSGNTGDFLDRRLRGPGGSDLTYQVYINAARTVVWGDGTRDTSPAVVLTPGANKDFTVYGEIPPGQYGDVGEYADSIVVTVMP
jgi:spore coat protein U-like protein